jgi:hypothetical protein
LLAAPTDAAWIEDLYLKKQAIAARFPAGRVILVGGSATLYGFSAETLSTALNQPVINLGVHAGLGAPYILERAKHFLKPGDTVLLVLEHTIITPPWPSVITARYVQFFDQSYILEAPVSVWDKLVFGVTLHDVFRAWVFRRIAGDFFEPINAYGDATNNLAAARTPYQRDTVAAAAPFIPAPVSPLNSPPHLADFSQWARANDVKAYIVWPPLLQKAAYKTPRYQVFFANLEHLFANLGIPILGSQTDFFLEEEDMFDTIYHPNEIGRQKVTATLLKKLLQEDPLLGRRS